MTRNIILEKIIELLPEEQFIIDEIIKGKMDNFDEDEIKRLKLTDKTQRVTFIQNKGYFDNDPLIPNEEKTLSPNWDNVYSLFNKICKQNSIPVKRVFRSSVNFSGHGNGIHDFIHKDHKFEHYVFLMYLNEFHEGYTFLFDQNKKIVESIVPAKNKIAIFPNMSHARGYTLPGETRVVWVVTFEMEKKNVSQS